MRAQTASPRPRAKRTRPTPARHASALRPWPRNAPTRIKRMTTTAITALIRSSRDHGTRPLFIEKAATSQYSQNAAHPTAKTSSTALIRSHSPTRAASNRPIGRLPAWYKHGATARECFLARDHRGERARGLGRRAEDGGLVARARCVEE